MLEKFKKNNNQNIVGIYKNRLEPTDIVNCYFNALNQVKGCSYTGQQYNYIDMYNDLSSLEYRMNNIYDNEIQ